MIKPLERGVELRISQLPSNITGRGGSTRLCSCSPSWSRRRSATLPWGGAELCVASDVPFFATKQGRTIGYSFAITAAIRRLTRAPMTLTGKPSLLALRFVARRLGVPVRALAVVGDDPVVEILMARRGGATALAVTTGTTRREEWARQARLHRPHGILGGLREVPGWVAGAEETADVRPPLRSMRARVKAGRSRTAVQSRPAAQRGVGRRSS